MPSPPPKVFAKKIGIVLRKNTTPVHPHVVASSGRPGLSLAQPIPPVPFPRVFNSNPFFPFRFPSLLFYSKKCSDGSHARPPTSLPPSGDETYCWQWGAQFSSFSKELGLTPRERPVPPPAPPVHRCLSNRTPPSTFPPAFPADKTPLVFPSPPKISNVSPTETETRFSSYVPPPFF